MSNTKLYTKDSIESLNPRDFTRLRPGVYCGSTEYSTQLLIEIVSNSIDEFKASHGNKIEVTIEDGGICQVRDYGQGFLVNEVREDGETILQASFDILNTSGKFSSDGVYEGTALGLNGIGSKLTNYLSHWLEVTSFRDGKFEKVYFKEGIFDKRDLGEQGTNETGTLVRWQASEEFFTNTSIELEKIKKMFHILTCLCPGLTIELKTPKETISYYSEHGLNDLVDDEVKNKELITNRMSMNYENDKNKIDMVMTYTSNYSLNLISYVNTGETDSGPHITQVKSIITREFNKFFRDKKWLKDKEENLTGDDIQEGLFIAFNITAPNISYDAQTKSRIVKIDMTPFTEQIASNIRYWLGNNEKDIKLIFDKAAAAKKAREAAKSARERVRENNKKKEKALKFDSKLADCYGKDRSKCEIYITEGDSASGNLKSARNNEFQAVMPVRGKILNCQKATLAQIQKNAEIMTMIDAFGLYIDTKTMQVTYDKDSLRYGKIIIESDADVDGAHIKNLFYTFIWNFCPQLIQDGYVYAGVPPLYKVTIGKEYKYIKNDEELENFKKIIGDKKYTVNRMKGLGEMSVDETEETLTDPDNRIIKQITVEDIDAADELFDDLMGTKVTPRKEFIKEHSAEGGQYNAE
jgi:DNA gyrase/topoisomerase IV subunit B